MSATNAGEEDKPRDVISRVTEFLEDIITGASVSGRWLTPEGEAIDGHTDEGDVPDPEEWPGAEWEEFTSDEQNDYLCGLSDRATKLLALLKQEKVTEATPDPVRDAAPDLMSALRTLLECGSMYDDGTFVIELYGEDDLLGEAEAALAKAEGRANG